MIANNNCSVQILEVSFSRSICCSLVWSAIRSAGFPWASCETPIIRPGIFRLNFAVVQIVPGGHVEQMIAQMTGTAVESPARFSGGGEGENLNNF